MLWNRHLARLYEDQTREPHRLDRSGGGADIFRIVGLHQDELRLLVDREAEHRDTVLPRARLPSQWDSLSSGSIRNLSETTLLHRLESFSTAAAQVSAHRKNSHSPSLECADAIGEDFAWVWPNCGVDARGGALSRAWMNRRSASVL